MTATFDDDLSIIEAALSSEHEAVLFQINLSRSGYFPRHREAIVRGLMDRGLTVLNRSIDDITKHNLHRLLESVGLESAQASRQGEPDELLFVKANLNWGGEMDFGYLPKPLHGACHVQPEAARIPKHDGYYPATRHSIPEEVWADPSVVIERYIQNGEDSFFRVYRAGNAIVVVKAHSPGWIKKLCGHPNDLNYVLTVDEILSGETALPAGLQSLIKTFLDRTAIDYFCVDVVHDTSDYFVIDLNLTPSSGTKHEDAHIIECMRQGFSDALT